MSRPRVLFVTSEVAPFSKTGGLADVSAALPAYLAGSGHEVRVITPAYASIDTEPHDFSPVDGLTDRSTRIGDRSYGWTLFRAPLPRGDVDVWFVHCPALYARGTVYTNDDDEHVRFLLLSRASLECCQELGWSPDVVHCNDWQSALMPAYLKSVYAWDRIFQRTKTVLTIHNLGYQGIFPASILPETGLAGAPGMLSTDDLQAGRVNFLKTGIAHADAVTTVSPTYAREIRTEALGLGLHELLRVRGDSLVGILNGIDTDEWNPRTDRHLDFRYSAKSLWRKEKNKESLLRDVGLPYEKGVPVLGMIGRLAGHKGIDLLFDSLPGIVAERDARFVLLGSGDGKYERFFRELQHRFSAKVFFHAGYHGELAHRIEGSADMFLMPSIYEPCGLNQMYSLAYGTIPIVHKTGGLADTVKLWDPATGEGNGVVFDHPTTEGVRWAVDTAFDLHADGDTWKRIVANAMADDWSWSKSGAAYAALYRDVLGGVAAEV